MKVTSLVCDWFSPNDGATPLVLVIETPDDYKLSMDECPELWNAFLEMFGDVEGFDIDPSTCMSDYIYEVFAVEIDLSSFEKVGHSQWLHIRLPE